MSPTMADGAGVAELLLQRLDGAGDDDDGLCSLEAAAALGLDHQLLVGAVKSLQALGEVGGLAAGAGLWEVLRRVWGVRLWGGSLSLSISLRSGVDGKEPMVGQGGYGGLAGAVRGVMWCKSPWEVCPGFPFLSWDMWVPASPGPGLW